MAIQMHYAFSDYISGSGIFAGQPYVCALGTHDNVRSNCMSEPDLLIVSNLTDETDALSLAQKISSTSNLKDSKVYLYGGALDDVVDHKVVLKNQEMYEHYGANITTQYDIESGHCIPTIDWGVQCNTTASPYINDCNYAGVEAALTWILGYLKPGETPNLDYLIEFNQTIYTDSSMASFQENGYAYIPTECANGKPCKVHVAFHGCKQSTSIIGFDSIEHAGYLELAEANNIAILFPQVAESEDTPHNPGGCFDWWGYSNTDATDIMQYATQAGTQTAAVWKMIQQMTTASS